MKEPNVHIYAIMPEIGGQEKGTKRHCDTRGCLSLWHQLIPSDFWVFEKHGGSKNLKTWGVTDPMQYKRLLIV